MKELFDQLPSFLREFDYSKYMSDNYVVVDFETTIIDKGSPYDKENSIVCASYKCGKGHKHYTSRPEYHKSNEYGQTVLVERIEQADFWVAHNTKFEYGWLERCGLPLSNTLAFCTLLAEYVLLSNRSKPQKLSLDRCLARRGMASKDSLGKALLGAGVCPSVWPERWLKPYSLQDVVAGEELFLHQRRVLAQQNKLRTLFTRCIFTPPLVDIEKNGMHLDDQRVPILYKNYNNRLGKLRTEIDKITGGANPKSYPQMRKVLYEDLKFALPKDKKWFTAGGEPTTKYEYIETLKPKNKKQRMFKIIKQEYGKVYDALSKSLKKFQDCITQTEDNILTASLNQAVTVTQRLSSTGKNFKAQFQNFARIFKPLFCARYEGWDIGEIDQAQLEYRVAVFLGQDEAGIYDIQHKVDSHTFTADEIFGAKFTVLDDASSERKNYRTKAKAHTFKPLYGGESGTKDEKRYYKAFKEKHKGITKVQNEWKMSAVNTGKVQCPSGLTFYFPGTRILEDGYVTNSTNICNYNVQSFATADIVPIGVTYQWHLMRAAKMESFLVNTIHDSSIGEVHPEEKELYREIGEFAFVDVVYDYLKKVYDVEFNVPLEAECEFNRNWADSESWRREYLK